MHVDLNTPQRCVYVRTELQLSGYGHHRNGSDEPSPHSIKEQGRVSECVCGRACHDWCYVETGWTVCVSVNHPVMWQTLVHFRHTWCIFILDLWYGWWLQSSTGDGRAVYHRWLMRAQIGPIQTGTADKTNDLYNEGKWDSLLQYNVFWIEPCHCKWPIYWWADHQRMFKCCRTKTHSHTHSGETNTCFCWACYS